ncbi:MazG-like family protein [Streptacidiphilus sp. P02-A3a]|uniref:MazG-like family protein n=1 Tax=Streptacidiphilus sp. P02-A3a TaxID=2704468 RepID=UPI0015FADFC8|nr:MazG-like family protein [Streptacidiphilus sp. P02-A3a]QMU67064.1 hypothetical protein GXP74_01390 [Streptacidiphilus sp. P02-A3a]
MTQPPASSATPGPDAWTVVGDLVAWLNESNGAGPQETALRLLKVTEESGEVAQAYIGLTGQNPRKGVTHTPADVAGELCDVIVAAMVALHSFTDQPARLLTDKLTAIEHRSRAFREHTAADPDGGADGSTG